MSTANFNQSTDQLRQMAAKPGLEKLAAKQQARRLELLREMDPSLTESEALDQLAWQQAYDQGWGDAQRRLSEQSATTLWASVGKVALYTAAFSIGLCAAQRIVSWIGL